MSELLLIFLMSFIIGLSGAIMPGSLLAAVVGESAGKGGGRCGPLMVAGHSILELVLLLALLGGLGPMLARDGVFALSALFGAVILIYLALSMLRSLPIITLSLNANTQARSSIRMLMIKGALLTVSNPYWILWWATIGLTFLSYCGDKGWLAITAFYIGHILSDLFWYSLVSVGVSRGKRFMTDYFYKYLIGSCAVFLLFLAFCFGYAGITKMLKAAL